MSTEQGPIIIVWNCQHSFSSAEVTHTYDDQTETFTIPTSTELGGVVTDTWNTSSGATDTWAVSLTFDEDVYGYEQWSRSDMDVKIDIDEDGGYAIVIDIAGKGGDWKPAPNGPQVMFSLNSGTASHNLHGEST